MSTRAEKVGRGKCPHCGEPVTYRRSAGGMLTHRCEACDSSGYAEPGGAAYKARMSTITAPAGAAEPAPKGAGAAARAGAREHEPKAASQPQPKKAARSVFDLGTI